MAEAIGTSEAGWRIVLMGQLAELFRQTPGGSCRRWRCCPQAGVRGRTRVELGMADGMAAQAVAGRR